MGPGITIITENIERHIPAIAAIYREVFPDHRRTMLGQSTCERYLRNVLQHKGYRLFIAAIDNDIAGFIIFHIDLQERLGRKWLLYNTAPILKFSIMHPLFTARMTSHVLQKIFQARSEIRTAGADPVFAANRPLRAYIETLGVKTAFQGLGVGKRLIWECIRAGEENHKTRLAITVDKNNHGALGLYKAMGFEPQESIGPEMDLVYFIKPNQIL